MSTGKLICVRMPSVFIAALLLAICCALLPQVALASAGTPTVAINGSKNAAHLALQIMAVKHPELSARLKKDREEMEAAAMKANEEVKAKFE